MLQQKLAKILTQYMQGLALGQYEHVQAPACVVPAMHPTTQHFQVSEEISHIENI